MSVSHPSFASRLIHRHRLSRLLACAVIFATLTNASTSRGDDQPDSQSSTPPASAKSPANARKSISLTGRPPRNALKKLGPYTQPLRFDPEDNGLSIDNPQIRWNMISENEIDLGGLKFESSEINVALTQIARDKATARYDNRKDKYVTTLSFQWPEKLVSAGTLTIETLDGTPVWTKTINQANRKAFRDELSFASSEMKKGHEQALWGQIDIEREDFLPLFKGGRFRMCLSQTGSKLEVLKICSRPFLSKSKGPLIQIFAVNSAPTDHIGLTFEGKQLGHDGIINFNLGQAVVLNITFANLSFIEIGSQPADPELLDAVESPDGKFIILTGHGSQPVGAMVKILSKPVNNFWAPTGIPQERVWQVALPHDTPVLRVLGAFNVPFDLYFSYDRLPKEADRVYIMKTRSSGTYSANPIVFGLTPNGGKVSSKESATRKTDATHFQWKFAAPEKGAENRATILVESPDAKRPWVAHHHLYRSCPYEFSGRLTGILDSSLTFIALGEVSAAGWLETLGFTENSLLSKQRWGLASRYFKSITSIQSSSGTSVNDYSAYNVDVKYNVLPGVWHRDEIVGGLLSYQQTSLAGYSIGMLGLGAYWARTMPRLFNDLFNLLPYMDYPKYVDMEFVYYPLTTSNAGNAYAMNFHGRVFWTHRLYGELGFGIRHTLISAPSISRPGKTATLDFSAAYGTIGLGMVF